MFTALTFLFVLLSVLSVIALIIGLIKPGKVLRFGNVKTRGRVILILLPTFFISFILIGVCADKAMTPEEKIAVDKKRAEEKLLKEQQNQEKIEKEKEEKEKKEQEKVAKAKEKEEQEMKAKKEKTAAEEKRKQEEEQKKAEKEEKEKADATEKERLKKEAEEKKQAENEKLEKEKTIKDKGFEDKVKEVASSEKTPTEKFDEISKYAHDYKPSKDEVKQFGDDIIKEYKDKNYIKDASNNEYMLTNIFKSQVVDRNASEKPLKDFAFDFWQNSKYNYRGVENATSSATQANERQMDKALSKMNK